MTYKELQRAKQLRLIADKGAGVFGGSDGGGVFMGRNYDFVLKKPLCNLHPGIKDAAQAYFSDNAIKWWGGIW